MELLIVIVVIAILAAITIVAYNGITKRAQASAALAQVEQAGKQVALWSVDNNSQYPQDLPTAQSAGLFKDSPSANFTAANDYTVNNSTNPANYCVTAIGADGQSYSFTSTSGNAVAGRCVTNYAIDPDAAGTPGNFSTSGSPVSAASTIATDLSHHGTTSLKKVVAPGASGSMSADVLLPVNTVLLHAGDTLSWSFWVYSSRAGSMSMWADATKVVDGTSAGGGGGGGGTVPANTWVFVKGSYTASTDVYMIKAGGYALTTQAGDTVWFDEFTVQVGSTLRSYGDGNSPGWFWNGTPNNSTSTGPAQTQ